MKTVMVTRLASVPPTRRSVWSISANTRCVWASKLPEMSLPSPSTVAVWPASQTTRPPSVMTAGEYARFFCASVPSRYFAMSAPLDQPHDRVSAWPAAALHPDAAGGGGGRRGGAPPPPPAGERPRALPILCSPPPAPWAHPPDRVPAWPAAALQSDAAGGGGGRIDAAVAQH